MSIDNETKKVITFYSYKGGTGRSMLVANAAWLLASAGYRILLIDWDLEAPGLHRYFKPFLADPELKETDGVIEWLTDYWDAVIGSNSSDIGSVIREYADPRRYTVSLNTEGFLPHGAGIDLICAGRQNSRYSTAVGNFDYSRLYEELQGADFIAASKALLAGPEGYDFVLVDSRTGVSDTAGICTVGLADALVVCFTYNNQSISGAANVAYNANLQAGELRKATSTDSFNAYRFPYRVIGVPSRVDHLDPERLEKRRAYAAHAFSRVLGNGSAFGGGVEQLIHAEVPYHPLYSYEEVLAICMERIEDQRGVLGATQRIVQEITGNASLTFKPLLEGQQRALRDAFGGGANATSTASASTAWDFFCRHLPDESGRLAFLDETFAFLIQLVNVAASSSEREDKTQFSRSFVLETELTADERRALDRLLLAGIVCRRVSQAGERTLELADDSIVANWTQLSQRLAANVSSIRDREAVIGCRKSWVASGRRIGQLAKIPDSISEIETLNERGTWLGNRNLDFVNAVRDAKSLAQARTKLSVERDDALQKLDYQRTEAVNSHRLDAERALEVRRKSLTAMWIVTTTVVVGATAFYFLQQQRADSQLQIQLFSAANERALSLERAKSAELELKAAKGQALQFLGLGVAHVRSKQWSAANAQFTEAIRLDPTLAEAFFQRAISAEKLSDAHKALEDYAAFYDLRPSLRGRISLIERMSEVDPVNAELMAKQLERALVDANDATRNLSIKEAASRLKAILDKAAKAGKPLPREAEATLRNVVSKLDPDAFRQKLGFKQSAGTAAAVTPSPVGTPADSNQPPLILQSNAAQVEKSVSSEKGVIDKNSVKIKGENANDSARASASPSSATDGEAMLLNARAMRAARREADTAPNGSVQGMDLTSQPPPVRAIPSIDAPSSVKPEKASSAKR